MRGGQFELVDRGGLGAAWKPSRAERGIGGEWGFMQDPL